VHDRPFPALLGRVAGVVLFLAGLAASSQLISYWTNATWIGRPWVRLGFYAFAGGLTLLAVVQGMRMVTAPRGSDLALPRHLLAFGAVLLAVAGGVQVVLYFLVPHAGSLPEAVSLGVGGSLAAARLWQRRGGKPVLPEDGA
jgi:hypothetical protein